MSLKLKNLLLGLAALALTALSLALANGADFGGADELAQEAITALRPDYQPWFNVLWQPPSGEVQSLLFALQAAIGAGFIGYYFGYLKGRGKNNAAH